MHHRTLLLSLVLLIATTHTAIAQQLGHKLLGSAGIDAGTQAPPGLYIINRLMKYGANELRDRNGNEVPIIGLDIDALGNGIGAVYVTKTKSSTYLSFALGAPVARTRISSDRPEASLSGYGFSDAFVQPIKAGWRFSQFDAVTSYMVYIPTGKSDRLGAGPGKGYWTHQFSVGGAAYSDTLRSSLASALMSFEINSRRRNIDIRRGNMLQIQGGVGTHVNRVLVLGVAGFALWQVSRDHGADIPPALRNERSRAFGIGPEIDVLIPALKLRIDARIEREFGVRSRPKGYVLAVGLTYAAWRPKP